MLLSLLPPRAEEKIMDTLFLATGWALFILACSLGLIGIAMIMCPDWFLR